MDTRLPLLFLLALTMVVKSSSYIDDKHWGVSHLSSQHGYGRGVARQRCNGHVGECTNEDEETMMESETSRRILAQGRSYISYDALQRDNVPCNRPGNSYYNCGGSGQANPYNRGCNVITECARATG